MNKLSFGKEGERLAYKYLQKSGYKIIETNFKTDIGEIDIICKKGGITVFTEVKTRMSAAYGLPREAVNYTKQKKYTQVAMQYIKLKNIFSEKFRFDVIEILGNKINHIENAFFAVK